MQLLGLLRRELRKACEEWVTEGTITPEQADRILHRYGTALGDTSDASLAYRVLIGVALLFVGLALLLLISANWDEIPRALRMGSLIGLTLTLNGLGLRQFIKNQPADGWFFLGGLSYGASIMLIAQIYHLGEHFPDGVLYWAAGLLPVLLLAPGRLLFLLFMGISVIWLFSEGAFTPPWAMLIFLAGGLWSAVRMHSSGLVFVVIAAAVSWLNVMLAWAYGMGRADVEAGHVMLNVGLLALLYALSKRLLQQAPLYLQRTGSLIGLWSLRGFLLLILPFTFSDFAEGFLRELHGYSDLGLWSGLGASLIAALLLIGNREPLSPARAVVFALPLLLLIAHGVNPVSAGGVVAIIMNVAVLVSAILLIQQGLRDGQSHQFYSGVGLLTLLAFIRYFDLFGDYLGSAAMFLAAAGVLYASARFWRRRQYLEGGDSVDALQKPAQQNPAQQNLGQKNNDKTGAQ